MAELEDRKEMHRFEMKELTKCLHSYEGELAKHGGKDNKPRRSNEQEYGIMPWKLSHDQIELGTQILKERTTFEGKIKVAVTRLNLNSSNQKQLLVKLGKKMPFLVLVRHPNIQQLIGAVFNDQHPPYVITELSCANLSLRAAYKQRQLLAKHQMPVFEDTAKALDYLHDCDIIHGDINSNNILLTQRPNGSYLTKISDLGSAKFARESLAVIEEYCAPEILRFPNDPPSKAEDIFSYGIVLCEVVTSQFPAKDQLPSMLQQTHGLWPQMLPLIYSCIEQDPDTRPIIADVLSTLGTIPARL